MGRTTGSNSLQGDLLAPDPAAGLLDQPRNVSLSLCEGMRQRRNPVTVRHIRISPSLQHETCRFLIACATLTEDHNFQQTGPAKAVDVIDVNLRRQQTSPALRHPADRNGHFPARARSCEWQERGACRTLEPLCSP
jgi:hypothetical protein